MYFRFFSLIVFANISFEFYSGHQPHLFLHKYSLLGRYTIRKRKIAAVLEKMASSEIWRQEQGGAKG